MVNKSRDRNPAGQIIFFGTVVFKVGIADLSWWMVNGAFLYWHNGILIN
jgi:hypothetical protein